MLGLPSIGGRDGGLRIPFVWHPTTCESRYFWFGLLSRTVSPFGNITSSAYS